MKVVLCQMPPSPRDTPPYDVALTCANLKRAGHDVVVVDSNNDIYQKVYKQRPYWKFRTSTHTEEHGSAIYAQRPEIFADEVRRILSHEPDAVVFRTENGLQNAVTAATLLKDERPGLPVVGSGSQTTDPRAIASWKLGYHKLVGIPFDMHVFGEDDLVLPRVLDALAAGRASDLSKEFEVVNRFLDAAVKPVVEDLDSLPFYDFTGFDFMRYGDPAMMRLNVSRSCVKRCAFCIDYLLVRKFRVFSGARWFEEYLCQMKRHPGVRHLRHYDRLLNGDVASLVDFCERMTRRFGDRPPLLWGGDCIITPEMTDEVVSLMARAGCNNIGVGFESGSPAVRESMNKAFFDNALASRFLASCKKRNIGTSLNVLIGFPTETEDDFQQTLDFVAENKDNVFEVRLTFPTVHVAPGSPLMLGQSRFGLLDGHEDRWAADEGRNSYEVRVRRFERFCRKMIDLGVRLAVNRRVVKTHAAVKHLVADLTQEGESPEVGDLLHKGLTAEAAKKAAEESAVRIAREKERETALAAEKQRTHEALKAGVEGLLAQGRFEDAAKDASRGGAWLSAVVHERWAKKLYLSGDFAGALSKTVKSLTTGSITDDTDLRLGVLRVNLARRLGDAEEAERGHRWLEQRFAASEEPYLRNLLLNEREITAGKELLESKPIRMTVRLTNRCNIRCTHCGMPDEKAWFTPQPVMDEIFGLMPYLDDIQWQGGEIFVLPRKMLRRCFESAAANPRLGQSIITNGVMIDAEWAEVLVRCGVHVRVSVDGATKEVYEKVRDGAKWEDLIAGLENLNREMERQKKRIPLEIHMVVMGSNHHQIPDMVELSHRLGVRVLDLSPIIAAPHENVFVRPTSDSWETIQRGREQGRELARRYGIAYGDNLPFPPAGVVGKEAPRAPHDTAGPFPKGTGLPLFCLSPWKKIIVRDDGSLIANWHCDRDVGHVRTDTLMKAWNGSQMREYRRRIHAGRQTGLCTSFCLSGALIETWRDQQEWNWS
jgi:anaerobic magnesium-protoporphyrin IX monomethyl ester cyclase